MTNLSNQPESDENQFALFYMIRNNFPENYIENCLNKGGIRIDYANVVGDTALHVAVDKGCIKIVEILLRRGAKVRLPNNANKTPIDLAKEKKENNLDPNVDWISIIELLEKASKRAFPGPYTDSDGNTISDSSEPAPKKPKKPPSKIMHDASGLKLNIAGALYQTKLLALFVHRAKQNEKLRPFRIATEMDVAEKFDDVVFQYTDERCCNKSWRFLQAKHKLHPDESRITMKDLMSSSNTDFSLQKYFISFCKIEQNKLDFEGVLKDFSIITNTNFNFTESTKQNYGELQKCTDMFERVSLNEDEILNFYVETFKAEKYRFNVDKIPEIKAEIKKILLQLKPTPNNVALSSLATLVIILNSNEIRDILEAIKTISVRQTIEELKREAGDKMRKIQTVRMSDYILEHFGTIFGETEINKLRATVIELRKTTKSDSKFSSLIRSVLVETGKLMDETKEKLEKAEELLEKYGKRKPIEPTELEKMMKTEVQKIIKTKIQKKVDFSPERELILDNFIYEMRHNFFDKEFDGLFDKFSKKFYFINSYPDEEHLGELIDKEIRQNFCLLQEDLLGPAFANEMMKFLKFYIDKQSYFYTDENVDEFFYKLDCQLASLMVSGNSILGIVSELIYYNIYFTRDLAKIHSFGATIESQILYVITPTIRLSAIRVYRSLKNCEQYQKMDSCVFVRLSKLLEGNKESDEKYIDTQQSFLQAFSTNHAHKLLVIECEEKKIKGKAYAKSLCDLHKRLQEILDDNRSKKVILIAHQKDAFVKKFELSENDTFSDTTNFTDLDEESKKMLLAKEQKIDFQGKKIELQRLVDKKLAEQVFDQIILSKFIEDDFITIGDKKAFTSIEYVKERYYERQFQLQKLNSKVLQEKSQLFFVTGADEDDLIKLGIKQEDIFIYESEHEYVNGIVIPPLDQSVQPENIYKSFGANAHWIVYRDHLFWKCSASNSEFMIQFIDRDYVTNDEDQADTITILEEEDFCKTESLTQKIVIIANESGTGKTTVLASIAGKMREFKDERHKDVDLWIVRINLNDFAEVKSKQCLKGINFKNDETFQDQIINFMTRMAIPGMPKNRPNIRLQQNLFRIGLEVQNGDGVTKPNIIIIFDGFDEICPSHKEKTTTLIRSLLSSFVTQIWVTTRVSQKDHLEQELKAAAYVLRPLSKQDQTKFASSYWKWHLKLYRKKNRGRRKFRRAYLDIIKYLEETLSNTKQLHDETFGKSISRILKRFSGKTCQNTTGQTYRQLMETIDDDEQLDFSTYIKELNERLQNFNKDKSMQFTANPLHLKMLVEVLFEKRFKFPNESGLFYLFHDFVNIKLEIYYDGKEGRRMGRPTADTSRESYSEQLRKGYNALAVDCFFGKDFKHLKKVLPELEFKKMRKEKDDHVAIGLVVLNENDDVKFIHPRYGDYFLSKYLYDNRDDESVKKLIAEIQSNGDYESILQFYNDQINGERNMK